MDIVERSRKKPSRQNYESRGAVNDRNQMEREEAAEEIERLREALHQIRFRIDNMPKDMSLTPNSAIFDLIRHQTILALGGKE